MADFGQALDEALTKPTKNKAVKAAQEVFQKIADDGSLDDVVKRAVEDIWKKDTENRPFAFYNTFFKGKVLGLSNKEREFFDKKIKGSRDAVIEALNGLGEELKNMSTEDIKTELKNLQAQTESQSIDIFNNTTKLSAIESENSQISKRLGDYNTTVVNTSREVGNIEANLNNLERETTTRLTQLDNFKTETGNQIQNLNEWVSENGPFADQFGDTQNALNSEIAERAAGDASNSKKIKKQARKLKDLTASTTQKFEDFTGDIKILKRDLKEEKRQRENDVVHNYTILLDEKTKRENLQKKADTSAQAIEDMEAKISNEITQRQLDITDLLQTLREQKTQGEDLTKLNDLILQKIDQLDEKLKNTDNAIQSRSNAQSNLAQSVKDLFELYKKQASTIDIDLNEKYAEFQKQQTINFVDFVEYAVQRRDLVTRMKDAINTVDLKTLRNLIITEGNKLYKRNYDELLQTYEEKINELKIRTRLDKKHHIFEILKLLTEKYSNMPPDPITVS